MLGIGRAGPLGPQRATEIVASGGEPGETPALVGGSGGAGGWRTVGLTERDAWTVVATAEDVGPATMRRLIAALGSARAVLTLAASANGASGLAEVLEDPSSAAAAGLVAAAADPGAIVARIGTYGVDVMTVDDADYPPLLRSTALPPPVLFIQGSRAVLSAEPAVAVVGTRRPTESGRRTAAQIATALVACDGVVVSGLAVGIDGAAHAAAVGADGRTVAVLGGGHDELFPRAHRRLANEIADHGGAVVSEFLPWVGPRPWSFPRRNRVISGLARSTVVVEAPRTSGALITARWALEEGRECFIVPGPIDAASSAGCLAFLRENHQTARVVAGIGELVVDLGLVADGRRRSGRGGSSAALAGLGPIAREVGRLVAAGIGTVDEVVAATELPVATVLSAITVLESNGLVVDALGRYRAVGALVTRPRRTRLSRQAARPGTGRA
jgi:DNA processing protein